MTTTPIAAGPNDVTVRGWIPVAERLPEPFDRKLKKPQVYLCYVKMDLSENIFGGMQIILGYGSFEWCDYDGTSADANEDGMVQGFGWHYERDSEGEFDSLMFDMNGKVTHWMPLPEAPNAKVIGAAPTNGERSDDL